MERDFKDWSKQDVLRDWMNGVSEVEETRKHPGLKARHLVSQLLGYSRRGKTRAVAGEMEKRAGYRRPRRDRSARPLGRGR